MIELITILIMDFLVGAEVDLFVPSFPELQSVFNLSPFLVELTLGVNLVAYCTSSFIVGNLGDRYGRKPVILFSLLIFVLGSLATVFAHHFWEILLGRFLQGIGISGPAVLSYLIIADQYTPEQQQKMMGILNGAVTVGMAFSPVIGSYVNLLFGWRGNFAVLLIIGLLCWILGALFLPSGNHNQKISLSFKSYVPVLKSRKVMYYIIAISFFIQTYWVFVALSPILYMNDLGVSLKAFGWYQGALAGVFAIFSFVSGYLIEQWGQRRCFFIGLAFQALLFLGCLILMFGHVMNPLWITLVMLLPCIGDAFPINILWPLMLEALPEAKGRVTAVFLAMRLLFTTLSLQLVSYFYDGTFFMIGLALCAMLVVAFWAYSRLMEEDDIFRHASVPPVMSHPTG